MFLGPTGAAMFRARLLISNTTAHKAAVCGQSSHDLSTRFHFLPALPHTRRHATGVAVRVSGSAVEASRRTYKQGVPSSLF